jgi:hypothetical protein
MAATPTVPLPLRVELTPVKRGSLNTAASVAGNASARPELEKTESGQGPFQDFCSANLY